MSTKIHVAGCGLGRPCSGAKGDVPQAGALLERLSAEVVMAGAAYDGDRFRQAITDKGALAVIPSIPSRARKHLTVRSRPGVGSRRRDRSL